MRSIWNGFVGFLTFIGKHFKALLLLLILVVIFAPSFTPQKEPNLMRIDLKGVITDSSSVLKQIQKASKSESIKGILLYVDSPGGSVSPSVEISYAIRSLAKEKQVVAYAAGSMASGSYYASAFSNYIVANPASMIGSIGVIAQVPNVEELAKKIGISEQVVSAGEYKQAGTFMREWTPKERESLEIVVNDIYDLFVNDVAIARGLDVEDKDAFANARVFIGEKAKDIGLVDSVGVLSDATKILITSSNITEPIWAEPDLADVFVKKLGLEVTSQIGTLLYGVKFF
ncbi:MAG: signal peptide peptidase SppA [Campylobacteraceae bacterium]